MPSKCFTGFITRNQEIYVISPQTLSPICCLGIYDNEAIGDGKTIGWKKWEFLNHYMEERGQSETASDCCVSWKLNCILRAYLSYFPTGGGFVLNNWLVPQANMWWLSEAKDNIYGYGKKEKEKMKLRFLMDCNNWPCSHH